MYQTEIPTSHRVGDRRKELRMPVVVGIKVVMPSDGFDAHLLQLTSTGSPYRIA